MAKKDIIRDYPTWALDEDSTLAVVNAINKYGGSATRTQIHQSTKISSTLGTVIASCKQYGLIKRSEGSITLSLSELGKEYCNAKDDNIRKTVIIKTLLKISYFRKLIGEKSFSEIPQASVLRPILLTYGIPPKDTGMLAGVFRRTLIRWGLKFDDLKGTPSEESTEFSANQDSGNYNTRQIPSSDVNDLVIVGWYLGKLANTTAADIQKNQIESILDDLEKKTERLYEVNKVIVAARQFLSYSDVNTVLKFMHDRIPEALEKDGMSIKAAVTEKGKVKHGKHQAQEENDNSDGDLEDGK